jgi:hypothetical protein
MKKVFLLLVVLLIVLPLSARPKIEFSPKGTLYLDGGVSFGIGADVTVNPKKQLGLRVNIAEFILGDMEGFSINSSLGANNPTTFDILYYTNIANLFSYVSFTLGFTSVGAADAFVIGGGLGLEKYMGKGNYLFFEPGIYIGDLGLADDFIFRLPFGFKIGI